MATRRLQARPAPSLLIPLLAALAAPPSAAQEIPTPEEFFGHRMGAELELADWSELVEYYRLLDERSDRLMVDEMGPSTLGAPFLALYISSPENLARLDELKRLNAMLSDPRGVPDAELEAAVENGRAVIVQSFALHSTEVAASQTAAEFTYDYLTREDEEAQRMRDEVVSIIIPSFNPDGTTMVAEWNEETRGTPYEGAYLPVLYHHYIGHDNNRDAFMQNTVESQYGAEIMFREWVPQAYVDHHQMGPYGARLYVPPYAEPIRPGGDPLVWREMAWYGAHIALEEEEAGKQGIINAAIYSGWGHFGFHWITPFHNIAGMLTESASAQMAAPLFLHPDQLQGGRRGLPEYEAQTTFPNPWPGGWWTVRDIVEQQKIAAFATVDIAARNREQVLRNAWLKAERQTERGREGAVRAFVIPADQHDRITADVMVNKLLGQGIEVLRAPARFDHEGRVYEAGTYVVDMAQPKRGVIRWLLGQTYYPDNTYTRARDGDPIRPYDMSADVIAEFMGVRVDPVETMVEADLAEVTADVDPVGELAASTRGWVLDGSLNESFRAVNLLQAEDVQVRRVDRASGGLEPGDFIVPASAPESVAREVARETGVDFRALETDAGGVSHALRPMRIGMYQRYYGGNMDEGWTRWLLERFEFPYTSLMDDDIRAGNLASRYDVIILPDDSPVMITGEFDQASDGSRRGWDTYPPEYRSGIGRQGVEALQDFVDDGGTLVSFAEAGEFVLDEWDLPVRNVVEGLDPNEFWSPGSTLRVTVDTDHPLGYGMPRRALAAFLQGNQVYEVVPGSEGDRVDRIVTFVDRDILRSGWLLGEDAIAEKSPMIEIDQGEGRLVLIGFRAQHRAQTHGTFKLVFNTLVTPPSEATMAAQDGAAGGER